MSTTPNLHDFSVPVFDALLDTLARLLERGSAHATARKFDPAVLLQARLFPDMFPLVRQVQIASDSAKFGVARLAGIEAPRFEDNESSFEDLIDRLARTRAFIQGVSRSALEGSAQRRIEVPGRVTRVFDGQTFLTRWAMPNCHFHVVTVYNILRHNGVEIGKMDFLGEVPQLA
jgi:hypothetical protein